MREMKDSGIPWVGSIPFTWSVRRGKFVLHLLSRPVLESDEVITCFRDGEVTLRRNRREDGFTVSLKEIGYQGIEPEDLVIHGMDGFAGAIGISDSRGKSSPVLVVCDSSENKKYIMYYLRTMAYNDVFTALATGIRVRSCDLRWNKLAELPYILPSKDEQFHIVANIEINTAKVDTLISNVQIQIEKLKAYKQSLITEVVTKGLDPAVPMKDSGVAWIGAIPAHWEVKKLKFLAKQRKEKCTENYPDTRYIGLENIESGNGNMIETDSVYDRSQAILFNCGNILFGKLRPYLAKVYVCHNAGCCSSEFCVFEISPKCDIQFIWSVLISQGFVDQVNFSTYGAKMPRANADFIQNMYIPVPPINEEIILGQYVKDKCAQIDRLIAIKQQKIEKLNQYKKSLIYEYVTGKKEV